MNWTLGRVIFALLCLAVALLMCAGYVGGEALIGAFVVLIAIAAALAVVRVFRR